MALIEEFRQTLEHREWKEYLEEEKREQRQLAHEEFLDQLEENKLFKQLLFAAEKQIEQDEKNRQQRVEIEHRHNMLRKEEEELE